MLESRSDKILRYLAGGSIFLMIFWNYYANAGGLYEKTIKDISDLYYNLFTPEGFTFAIWGVIYIGMIGVALMLFKNSDRLPTNRWKFSIWIIAQSLFNSMWIHFFLVNHPGQALIEIFLLLCSLLVLLTQVEKDGKTSSWIKWSIGLYAGWVSAASIANTAVLCTALDWSPLGLEAELWYKLMTGTAAVLGALVFWKMKNYLFPIALVWALIGIAFSHTDNTGLYYQALIPAFFLFLFVLSQAVRNTVRQQ